MMPLLRLSGRRPALGKQADGGLTPCPQTPNCVCSCQDPSDKHYIEPLQVGGAPEEALARVKALALKVPGATVEQEQSDYLRLEFTSKLLGFVDDVEFLGGPGGEVQVRSASRLGREDFNVNRRRIEAIRSQLR